MNSQQILTLAVQHHQAGNLGPAEKLYRDVLQCEPRNPDALHLLGVIACQFERHELAVELIRSALRERPTMAGAHSNLGTSLQALGQLDEAVASYRRAIQLMPDHAEAHNNLGTSLQALGQPDEAVACYRRAIQLKSDYPEARANLGNALQELGDFERAEQAFREALRLDPGHVEALWGLATQLRGNLPDADRALLERRLAEPKPNNSNRSKVHFALAQVCDANGEYELAAHMKKANALQLELQRRRGKVYDIDENARYIDSCLATFTPEFFERTRGFGLNSKQPVFIVGLPRSGTTLTEQILAAHSQVFGAGELFLTQEDFRTLKACAKAGTASAPLAELQHENTVRDLAQRHLDQLRNHGRTAERIVDKLPDNYLYLGMLAVLFPNATFIHCRRDLRDTALSCWINSLLNPWSHSPDHIVARMRDYQRLMEHWRAVLPVRMLELDYEDTVADLPGTARRLVEFCGLPWEPACLKFNEGNRQVRTASKIQVRERIYTSSVGRWRHYERELSEMFAALTPLQDRYADGVWTEAMENTKSPIAPEAAAR